MATGLMIAGGLVWIGSFVFAGINIDRKANKIFSSGVNKALSGSGGMVTRHISAKIGMVLGGMTFAIGLAILIIQNPS